MMKSVRRPQFDAKLHPSRSSSGEQLGMLGRGPVAGYGGETPPLSPYNKEGEPMMHVSPRPESALAELSKAVFNYANLVVSNALVAVPFAVEQAGVVVGVLVLVLTAVLSGFVSYYMVLAGRKSRRLCYEELAAFTLGRPGYFLALFVMFINEIGSMISRLVLVGDMVGPVHRTWLPHISRKHIVLVTCLVIVLPLSLLRKMESLRFSSMGSVMANTVVALLLFSTAWSGKISQTMKEVPMVHGKDPFMCFGLVSFLFANQEFAFSIFRSSTSPVGLKKTHWRTTIIIANALAILTVLAITMCGLAAFGGDVASDVLDNYNDYDVAANIARCLVCFIVLSGFPMDLFITRHVFSRLLGLDSAVDLSLGVHISLTLLVFATVLVLGGHLKNLGLVQSVVGSVCGTLIMFVLPPVFVLRTNYILERKWIVSPHDVLWLPIIGLGVVAGYKGISNSMTYDL